ncbi:patatin-like phospholipase family protein [Clostridium arbusti]|uniref:patatin-like phospholipase family protein n=1 Tax=Clostridium arbusti TaxID=1137848 RepID=UPI0002890C1D|nr:patatin-like phospholipase family protein [Clostridium arbusti]
MKVDAVFEGGGMKGIGFVGAINCLEDNGYEWQNLAGTSAGSIVAALLAVGYSGKELKTIMMDMDYGKMIKRNFLNDIPIVGNMLQLVNDYGVYNSVIIEKWMSEHLEAKGKTKFKDLYKEGKVLKIIAADITRRSILIIPDDLKLYGIDPLEFDIAKAVRMSSSIPFFFKPVKLKNNNKINYIVDGGLISNFPIWIFDSDSSPKWPTFGFKFVDHSKKGLVIKKDNFISYSIDTINTALSRNEEVYVGDKNAFRTISIPTKGVKTTDFNLSKKKTMELYNSGYDSAKEFINSWDFSNYILKYRMQL